MTACAESGNLGENIDSGHSCAICDCCDEQALGCVQRHAAARSSKEISQHMAASIPRVPCWHVATRGCTQLLEGLLD